MMDTLDIEVALASKSVIMAEECLTTLIEKYLLARKIRPNTIITEFECEEGFSTSLKSLLHYVSIGNTIQNTPFIEFKLYKIKWHIFMLENDGASNYSETNEEGEEITLATHLTLPCRELFSLWENLYYDCNIKEELLKYARTMMTFSNKSINPNIVCCNKVILLHGPPGTGKTSLCKALAQKLTITMKDLFSSGLLIEINSHSLFSRYFSESGKLVTRMFSKIKEMCRNEKTLICVLIDEVESLAHARNLCGNEPSDAVRVVNAMLTQIDQIRLMPNVLVFATSNLTDAIDVAFVDRADIKQFLGLPSVTAVYKIYHSCITEMIRASIIQCDADVLDRAEMIAAGGVDLSNNIHRYSKRLLKICEKSVGLSGRTLRKIPFLAHALYVNNANILVSIEDFLNAMEAAVERELEDKKSFNSKVGKV